MRVPAYGTGAVPLIHIACVWPSNSASRAKITHTLAA
jgi:hypothetical protein